MGGIKIEVRRSKSDWMYGELLDFTFNDKKQDIDKFLNHPYWYDRYGMRENLEALNFLAKFIISCGLLLL